MNKIISRPFPKTMGVSWRHIMICSLLVVFLSDHGRGKTIIGANKNQKSELTVHCWRTRNCTGSIFQSFREVSNGCRFGCMSYIRGRGADLKKILLSNSKLHLKHCVSCPTQPPSIARPPSKCTSNSCRPNHKCVKENKRKVVCVDCSTLPCKKSGKVCGTDGKTYKSECDLICLWKPIKEAYQGPCQAKPTCKTITCKPGWQCNGTNSSTLQQNNGALGSIPIQGVRCNPGFVCGSDGYTYVSLADLRRIMFCKMPPVRKARDGPCHPSDKPRKVSKNNSCFVILT